MNNAPKINNSNRWAILCLVALVFGIYFITKKVIKQYEYMSSDASSNIPVVNPIPYIDGLSLYEAEGLLIKLKSPPTGRAE